MTSAADTAAAFDALGLAYEHAFRGLPALDAALDRLERVLPAGARVGSGTGRPVAERLAAGGQRVIGIDVAPRMVDIPREQVPGRPSRSPTLTS